MVIVSGKTHHYTGEVERACTATPQNNFVKIKQWTYLFLLLFSVSGNMKKARSLIPKSARSSYHLKSIIGWSGLYYD